MLSKFLYQPCSGVRAGRQRSEKGSKTTPTKDRGGRLEQGGGQKWENERQSLPTCPSASLRDALCRCTVNTMSAFPQQPGQVLSVCF